VVTLNPEMVMSARANAQVLQTLKQADCFVADGVGLQLAAKLFSRKGVRKYPGVDLALDLMRAVARLGRPVYLLGAKPGIASRAADDLRNQINGLVIAGERDGYFAADQDHNVAAEIAASQPGLLLVGMGSPRQDEFIVNNRAALSVPLMVGVGGSLEVFAGEKRRAPLWIQRSGMEWLYRSLQDFSRVRRLSALVRFAMLCLGMALTGRGQHD
jgi:N-acetylglucosaminyldiphosphoundecaprenol N-acetyl-beta-D-mannosaminyltransferase